MELYLVTPPALDPASFAPKLEAALDGGPIACVQLWLSDPTGLKGAAEILRPIVQDRDIAFTINGDPALAATLNCDGVHLDGADVKTIKAARKTIGADGILGVSCYASRHLGMEAAEAGADYISFGPVYATSTKNLPADEDALGTLSWWAEMMEVPCVAVGGVTTDRIPTIAATGCEFVCAVSSVWDHPDGPGAGVASLIAAIDASGVPPA